MKIIDLGWPWRTVITSTVGYPSDSWASCYLLQICCLVCCTANPQQIRASGVWVCLNVTSPTTMPVVSIYDNQRQLSVSLVRCSVPKTKRQLRRSRPFNVAHPRTFEPVDISRDHLRRNCSTKPAVSWWHVCSVAVKMTTRSFCATKTHSKHARW